MRVLMVKTCSASARARLIKASLAGRPPALVTSLDEPAPPPGPGGAAIAGVIPSWSPRTTLPLTTQYMEEADHLAGHIAVIDHGQVIAKGIPDELKAKIGGQVLEVRPAIQPTLTAPPSCWSS